MVLDIYCFVCYLRIKADIGCCRDNVVDIGCNVGIFVDLFVDIMIGNEGMGRIARERLVE